jgi:hypothetical protein
LLQDDEQWQHLISGTKLSPLRQSTLLTAIQIDDDLQAEQVAAAIQSVMPEITGASSALPTNHD